VKIWAKRIGVSLLFVFTLVAITALLRMRFGDNVLRGEDDLLSSLHNLYFIPILVAALLLGRGGAMGIAILAIVASSFVNQHGFTFPITVESWGGLGIRGAFFISLGYLAARIAERVRANAREWQSLLEISRSINSSLDLDETLQAITKQSVELTTADACSIRLLDGSDGELVYAKTWGLSDAYQQKGPLTMHDDPLLQQSLRGIDVVISDVRRTANIQYREEMLAEGILSVLILPLRTGTGVIGLLKLYRKRRAGFSARDKRVADAFAEQAAIAIQNARLYASIRANYLETVRALMRAIEARDPLTLGHSERVARLAIAIARTLKLTSSEMQAIEFGAILHDIGKIGLDEQTLAKTGHLSLDEQMLMEMHPMIGKSIIEPVEFLRPCTPIVFSHHERWDGAGYPEGLRETEIPLLARIIALVDAYDHALQRSAGKAAATARDAVTALQADAGSRFDPKLVDVLITVLQRQGALTDKEPAAPPQADAQPA